MFIVSGCTVVTPTEAYVTTVHEQTVWLDRIVPVANARRLVVFDHGHVVCTCPGYWYRGRCKHIAVAVEAMAARE